MKTIIKNGIVVTMNGQRDLWSRGYVAMEGTKLVCAGPMEELAKREEQWREQGEELRTEDARGAIIMPGMINTHCHLGMAPFRGLGDD